MSLADFFGYAPAGFLYLLALAAQVSGYSSPSIAILLAVAGTAWLIGHWAHKWHLRRRKAGKTGVEAWHLLAVGIVGAWLFMTMALAAAGWAIWNGQGFNSTFDVTQKRDDGPLTWDRGLTLATINHIGDAVCKHLANNPELRHLTALTFLPHSQS